MVDYKFNVLQYKLKNNINDYISDGYRKNSIKLSNESFINFGKTYNVQNDNNSTKFLDVSYKETYSKKNKILGLIQDNESFSISTWIKLDSSSLKYDSMNNPLKIPVFSVRGYYKDFESEQIGLFTNNFLTYPNHKGGFLLYLKEKQTVLDPNDREIFLYLEDNSFIDNTGIHVHDNLNIKLDNWYMLTFTYKKFFRR